MYNYYIDHLDTHKDSIPSNQCPNYCSKELLPSKLPENFYDSRMKKGVLVLNYDENLCG